MQIHMPASCIRNEICLHSSVVLKIVQGNIRFVGAAAKKGRTTRATRTHSVAKMFCGGTLGIAWDTLAVASGQPRLT